MGNSLSTTAPTASTNVCDSEYFQQECAANNDEKPVDTSALVSSYVPLYESYLERIRQALSDKEYKFNSNLNARNARGWSVDALTIKGRLRVSCINRVLNELCKQGRFHDDLRIVLHLLLPVKNEKRLQAILRQNGADLFVPSPGEGSLCCDVGEAVFVQGWGIVGTANVYVRLALEDLESYKFLSPFKSLIDFFRNQDAGAASDESSRVVRVKLW